MNRKLFYENEEHGEALFIEVLSFIIPMDENTLRGKQENERKQVSKLLTINHDWYDVIKAGYYSRFHIYESIKQHYDDLDFELLIKYCIGEEYTKNVNFSKAKSVMMDSDLPGAYQSISFAAANESFIISRSTSFPYRLNI